MSPVFAHEYTREVCEIDLSVNGGGLNAAAIFHRISLDLIFVKRYYRENVLLLRIVSGSFGLALIISRARIRSISRKVNPNARAS